MEEREAPNNMPGRPITTADVNEKSGFMTDPEETQGNVIVDYDVPGALPLERFDGDTEEETKELEAIRKSTQQEHPKVQPSNDEIHENHEDTPYARR